MGVNTIKNSFTLMETVVMIGIVILILPVVFSIVFLILQQQVKIIRLQEVKKQGDLILNTIALKIRNEAVAIFSDANTVDQKCTADAGNQSYSPSSSKDFFFTDYNNNVFNFTVSENIVKYNTYNSDGSETKVDLSTDKVIVENFSLSCNRVDEYSPPVVSIIFTVKYSNSASGRGEEQAEMNYQTKIKLREHLPR